MNKIGCPLRLASVKYSDQPFIINSEKTFTFRAFDRSVTRLANLIRSLGVAPDDRIALTIDSKEKQLLIIYALIRVGGVAAPMSNRFPSLVINAASQKIKAKFIISDRRSIEADSCRLLSINDLLTVAENIDDLSDEELKTELQIDLDQPAAIIFSSGSTAGPKAILHTLGNHYYNALGANENLPFELGDRWLLSLPLYHVGGLAILFRALLGGGTIIIPDQRIDLPYQIEQKQVTHISVVSNQLRQLLKADNLESIRKSIKLILLGGGPIDSGLVQAAFRAGLPLARTYGLTEIASQLTTSKIGNDPKDTNSSGKLLNYREMRLSESGEILVRGKTLFTGYVDGEALKLPVNPDGWFATGDRGELDSSGNLTVLGRIDNMFISGGENIYPEEIETALLTIDSLTEAIVVPISDQEFGERPVAFVRFDSSATINPSEIAATLEEKLPRFKIPIRFFPWPHGTEAAGLKPSRSRLKKLADDTILSEESN